MKRLIPYISEAIQYTINQNANLIEIYFSESISNNQLEIVIKNNGKNIETSDTEKSEKLQKEQTINSNALKNEAEKIGGDFSMMSAAEHGTILTAKFKLSHLKSTQLEMAIKTIIHLVIQHLNLNIIFTYMNEKGEYMMQSNDIKSVLDDMPIDNNKIEDLVTKLVMENINTYCK